jgi:hypothetical protein
MNFDFKSTAFCRERRNLPQKTSPVTTTKSSISAAAQRRRFFFAVLSLRISNATISGVLHLEAPKIVRLAFVEAFPCK